MSAARPSTAARAKQRGGPTAARAPPTPGEIAWLAAIPCALAILAAIVLLGPPLGSVLFPASDFRVTFWRNFSEQGAILPEPTEHARYLLALLGPLLLSGAVVLGVRHPPTHRWQALPRARAVRACQALLVAFLVACVVAQHVTTWGRVYLGIPPYHRVYFTWATLAVAVVIAVLLAVSLLRGAVVARARAWTRETSRRRVVAFALAALLAAIWLLTAVNTEASIGAAHRAVADNIPVWMDETFAVLDGRPPLVDFHAQYSELLPYLSAGAMSIFGASLGVWAITFALVSWAAVVSLYAVLRRVVKRSLVALALYAPVLATGFFMERGPLADRYGPANAFSLFPMRYAGPYLLAWLTARQLDGARPRQRWLLFLAAGLVAINNVEFGIPALGASLAAVLWTTPPRGRRGVLGLLRDVVLGLAAAAALTSLLTLAVAGSLPHFGMLLTFARLYGVEGFGMLPMRAFGFHLVLYVTFSAALVIATVRAVAKHEDALLTGMLAWAGVFGLGAGGYFAGRSHPEVLIDLFAAWAIALGLLVVVAVRAVLARPSRRASIAELAVFAGLGIAVCSLVQTPTPWSQIERLGQRTATPEFALSAADRFVASVTAPGEPIAIIAPLGHRIAYDTDRVNVTPYASLDSMPLRAQLGETIAALRSAHGRALFFAYDITDNAIVDAIERAGFHVARGDAASRLVEMVSTR